MALEKSWRIMSSMAVTMGNPGMRNRIAETRPPWCVLAISSLAARPETIDMYRPEATRPHTSQVKKCWKWRTSM